MHPGVAAAQAVRAAIDGLGELGHQNVVKVRARARHTDDLSRAQRQHGARSPSACISAAAAQPLDSRAMAQADDDLFGAEHVRVYRETGGERGYNWRGATILLLTTEGRNSGQPRITPLIHRTDGDRFVVVASKGGSPQHPDWYRNLQANPDALIEVKDQEVPVRAQDARGAERERLWGLMTEVWPAYDDYQKRTEREIPVVVFSRR